MIQLTIGTFRVWPEHTPILRDLEASRATSKEDDNVNRLFYCARSCQQSLSVPEGGREAIREQPDGEDQYRCQIRGVSDCQAIRPATRVSDNPLTKLLNYVLYLRDGGTDHFSRGL